MFLLFAKTTSTAQCGCCCIGGSNPESAMTGICDGTRVDAGEEHPTAACTTCEVTENFYDWTVNQECLKPPTCTDNIQNRDEERVDCGGTHCEPCADLCVNGELDSGEVGIDCGGICPKKCAHCDNGLKVNTVLNVFFIY